MDPMILLSVVVPAHNAAAYISECMASVLRQAAVHGNVELIVVVDGATDETLWAALRAAIGHEETVRIVAQENLGASAARNRGLGLANGKYIAFLDADDLWRPEFLATVLPHLTIDSDLIEFDAALIAEDGEQLGILKIASAHEGGTETAAPCDFVAIFRCYAWARIYRTTMVRARPFPEGRRFEDIATTPWHHWTSRHTVSIGRALISYRQHSKSVVATPRMQDVADITAAIKEASAMYFSTKSDYWLIVTHRIFQFACRRTTYQPFPLWKKCAHPAREAAKNVPVPPGAARWLQANATLLYVTLLYLKRSLKSLTVDASYPADTSN